MNPKEIPNIATRRQFLRLASGAMVSATLPLDAVLAAQDQATGESLASRRPRARWQKSVVVTVQDDFVVDAPTIRPRVLEEMFDSALRMLGRAENASQAWRKFLKPDDIVGIKFNPYGDRVLDSSEPLASVIVNSLIQSGWPADQLVLVDGPGDVAAKFKTRPPQPGWSPVEVDFGSGQDQLAAFIEQVSAIINVPLLKDDNITGISGCLKNITYHLIKHPARFHDQGCTPYLGDIYALPQIFTKLRLNIMNGLRVGFHGGPLVDPDSVSKAGALWLGRDPIAVDIVCLETLNIARREAGLPQILPNEADVPALLDAAAKGLGNANLRKIERLTAPN